MRGKSLYRILKFKKCFDCRLFFFFGKGFSLDKILSYNMTWTHAIFWVEFALIIVGVSSSMSAGSQPIPAGHHDDQMAKPPFVKGGDNEMLER